MSGHSAWDGEADEPTTILRAPSPDAGEDGKTHILLAGSAEAPAWGEAPEDEPTRIIQAPLDRDSKHVSSTDLDGVFHGERNAGEAPDDERTHIIQAPLGIETAPPPQSAYGDAPEDERTHILVPPRGDPDRPVPQSSAFGDAPEDEPTRIQHAAPHGDTVTVEHRGNPPQAEADEPTSVPVAPQDIAAQEATAIMRAAAPGAAAANDWFDAKLTDFTNALTHDEAGALRASPDRRALAAAARDMIERVALRDTPRPGTALPDATLQPGQLLTNSYFVRALIARGGVGEIYRARHRDLKTEHAIKILLPRYALDTTLLSLMLEEARLLALVRHDAVVGCQGFLRDSDGRPMLVMDYLRGATLSARLREGPLDAGELAQLARRLAGGLAAIHEQGIVHQDISPDNIILAENSPAGATIIDFGLARSLADTASAHRSIDFAGKFSWCSPEQLAGKPAGVDARSDLYSLGLVLAASGLGYRLEMGNDPASARAARQTVPLLPGIAEPMASVVRRLLEPAPYNRPDSALAVLALLQPKPVGWRQRLFGAGR